MEWLPSNCSIVKALMTEHTCPGLPATIYAHVLSIFLFLLTHPYLFLRSGKVVEKLRYHQECVRDLSWHPTQPLLATVSFDGSIWCVGAGLTEG